MTNPVGRPRKYDTEGDKAKIVFYTTSSVKDAIMRVAAKKRVSRTALINSIIATHFDNATQPQ